MDVPLRAAYTIGELSRASHIDRRRLQRILEDAGVCFLTAGKLRIVSLSELERKVPPLWEGIQAACSMANDDDESDRA